MTLNAELRAFYEARQQQIPAEIRDIMQRAGQELADSGRAEHALTVGDRAPGSRCPPRPDGTWPWMTCWPRAPSY